MSRTIAISTDVFAAIWAQRQEGEETENTILRRVLGCNTTEKHSAAELAAANGGVHDTRNGVHFPEGFRAVRIYKRKEYTAVATSGVWMREDTGARYPTLNQLNDTIAAGPENIWNGNWKYRDTDGSLRSINDLRR